MTSMVKDKGVFVSAELEERLGFSVHCFLTQFIFGQNFIRISNGEFELSELNKIYQRGNANKELPVCNILSERQGRHDQWGLAGGPRCTVEALDQAFR